MAQWGCHMAKKGLTIGMFVTSQREHPAPKGQIWAPIDLAIEIADGLKAYGHKTVFYAPPSPKLAKRHGVVSGKIDYSVNSRTFLKHETRFRREQAGPMVQAMHDQYLYNLMVEDAKKGKLDVIHSHRVERTIQLARYAPVPTLITLHDPLWPLIAKSLDLFNGRHMHLVSISDAQRKPNPKLNYAATVYNGVDTSKFAFSAEPEDHFLFAGRLVKQKNVTDAIKAAKMTKSRLRIVGKWYDRGYFEKEVQAKLTGRISYGGLVPREHLPKVYGKAKALLMPIKWEEPFGLVMTEAMSCGTPVIAYGHGSVPEVVKHGKTGFIVRNAREMAAAMKKIDTIDRQACREHVERHFSLERMVANYERLYRRFSR